MNTERKRVVPLWTLLLLVPFVVSVIMAAVYHTTQLQYYIFGFLSAFFYGLVTTNYLAKVKAYYKIAGLWVLIMLCPLLYLLLL